MQFIGVSEDEYPSTAARLVREHGLTFPVVMDGERVLKGRYRVSEMPVTFVLDSNGIVHRIGGPDQTEADLDTAISAVAR